MKKSCLLFMILFLGNSFLSFSIDNIDSLRTVYSNKKLHDTIRFEALYKIVISYAYSDPDSGIYYGDKLINEANANKNSNYEIIGYNGKAVCYINVSEFDTATMILQQGEKLALKTQFKKGLGRIYNNYGLVYENKNDFVKALNYHQKSLMIMEEIGFSQGIGNSLNNIGSVYTYLDNYKKAIPYFERASVIFSKIKEERKLANTYSNIGGCYEKLQMYNESAKFIMKALNLRIKTNDRYGMANSYGELGSLLNTIPYEQLKSEFGTTNRDSAVVSALKKAIMYYKEFEDNSGLAYCYEGLADVFIQIKQHSKALPYLDSAYTCASAIDLHIIKRNIFKDLSEVYVSKNNYEKAFFSLKRFVSLNDTILNDDKRDEIARREISFQFEKKATADSVMNAEEKKVFAAKLEKEKTQRYALIGGFILVLVFSGFMYNRFLVTKRQKNIIEEQKKDVEVQKRLVEHKNTEITQSIQYAQKIQNALLPSEEVFRTILPDSFILFKPKDIVSGDFYWVSDREKYVFYATADCTGHGVPGGFMSMLGTALLNEIIDERKIDDCGEVLTLMREKIMQALKQAGDSESKDGMDMVLIRIDKENMEMQYAAANNSMYIIGNKQSTISNEYCVLQTAEYQLFELPCDKMPVGVYHSEVKPFKTYKQQLQKGDTIYTYTDGYADQFGGDKGKKYTYKRLRENILNICNEKLNDQKNILETNFQQWKGSGEQIDDVCLIGVRV